MSSSHTNIILSLRFLDGRHTWIVSLTERRSQRPHRICDLLRGVCPRRRKGSCRIVSQFLTFRVVASLLEIHFEVVEETVVGWTCCSGAAQGETASSDVVFDEFAMV